MEPAQQPSLELARRTLPGPLLETLVDLFAAGPPQCVLVGGSALSGFYAGHRRSDDLDLFTRNPDSFRATVLAVRALAGRGVELGDEFSSAHYHRATGRRGEHTFTIDVVLDRNFFQVGSWHSMEKGIQVAALKTLLMTKSAALVSRASEKDLFDLIWLFENLPDLTLDEFIELGQKIDGGLNRETLLLSLTGANWKKEACDFALDPQLGADEVLRRIQLFCKQLVRELADIRRVKPPAQLVQLVKRIKKLR